MAGDSHLVLSQLSADARQRTAGLLDLAEWGRLWTGEGWAAELTRRDDAGFVERLRSQTGRARRRSASAKTGDCPQWLVPNGSSPERAVSSRLKADVMRE